MKYDVGPMQLIIEKHGDWWYVQLGDKKLHARSTAAAALGEALNQTSWKAHTLWTDAIDYLDAATDIRKLLEEEIAREKVETLRALASCSGTEDLSDEPAGLEVHGPHGSCE